MKYAPSAWRLIIYGDALQWAHDEHVILRLQLKLDRAYLPDNENRGTLKGLSTNLLEMSP
jgi:hypothetical protein